MPLDAIVHEFQNGASPEAIRQSLPTLTLEQVYGAVAFYLGHKEQVEAALRETGRLWEEFRHAHPVPADLKETLGRAPEQTSQHRLSINR